MATTYTVKKGDTLSQIALSNNTTVANLVKLNDITDPDYIVVGQVIKLSGTATVTKSGSSKATIKAFGLQSNTDRTVYATWAWNKSNTENYKIVWYYDTGNGVWFEGTNTTVTVKQSTYNAPSNANRVKFVVKPVSKTYKSGKKTRSYWTASWSTAKIYNFADNPPGTPPAPTVTINKKRKLTAKLTNLDVNATTIQFQIVRNDTTVYKTGTATIKTKAATYSCTVASGHEYKVRCRAYRSTTKEYGAWSEYSDNVDTIPYTPTAFKTIRATSATSVYLEWNPVSKATSYDIEYATKKEYFDGSDATTTQNGIETTQYEKTGLETGHEYFFRIRATNSKGSSTWSKISSVVIGKDPAAPTTWSSTTTATSGDDVTLYWVHNSEDGSSQVKGEIELIIDGVKSTKVVQNSTDEDEKDKTSKYVIDTSDYDEGTKILWRVRTCGVTGKYGDWSVQRTIDVYSPPTLELNVTSSDATKIHIKTNADRQWSGLSTPYMVLKAGSTYSYSINVDSYKSGYLACGLRLAENSSFITSIKATSTGYYSKEYTPTEDVEVFFSVLITNSTVLSGDMTVSNIRLVEDSGDNEIDYSTMTKTNNVDVDYPEGEPLETLESFPFYVSGVAEPNTQTPIGYHISIISTETYETVNEVGSRKIVSSGETVYSEFFDISGELFTKITASDVDLENNVTYKLVCVVTMNSGLTAEESMEFDVAWTEDAYEPNAEIVFDEETYTTSIRPFCEDENGNTVDGITLSVYRREFDGRFTELATDISNGSDTYITDPHPALDFARYRVVAMSNATGAISYYDVPGYPVGCKFVIIQWDEEWTSFNTWNDDQPEEGSWGGSLLRLPYNIDVSDNNNADVALVEYIGRSHPVSYYGTQLGSKSTWNVVIDKSDEETLYALRRLAAWMGDVYVREPSGSGYWANIAVSFSQKHCEVTIPVTLNIVRVEGGA